MFYDINANSNLRPSVAEAFGFDPFERVVDFLAGQLAETLRTADVFRGIVLPLAAEPR